jgi:hypothetical protein
MEPASTIYEAALTPRNSRKARRRNRIDLVVRRRDDGTEIVRTPADLGSPDALLATAQGDLQQMTADEFLHEWKMPQVR